MKRILTLIAIGIIIGAVLYFFKNRSVEITESRLIGNWKLESYNGNKDLPASITFQKNGKFTAHICNTHNGSYEVSEGRLQFTNTYQTIMACDLIAPRLTEAENSFHEITQAKIEHGKLKLYSNTNTLIFTKKFF